MLRVEPAEFFCFYPSLVTFWGTLVANDAKIVHFTFSYIFWGTVGPRCFLRAMMGPPLDTLLRSGSKNWMSVARAGAEQERSMKKYSRAGAERERSESGEVSGVTERRERWAEISTAPAPLPLRSHARLRAASWLMFTFVVTQYTSRVDNNDNVSMSRDIKKLHYYNFLIAK